MINPNPGSSRKEKQMNAIIRTAAVAVLVAPGLALTAWARGTADGGSADRPERLKGVMSG